MFSITCGSKTHHFCADDPEKAEHWVTAIRQNWYQCVNHGMRTLTPAMTHGSQVHHEQKLVAENSTLRSDLSWAKSSMRMLKKTATTELLAATQKANHLEIMLREQTEYLIHVQTGKRKGASTDANIYIELAGNDRRSGTLHLADNNSNTRPFQRGQMDVFTVTSLYLGNITEVVLWHDGSGHQPHWYCEHVKVVCSKTGRSFPFLCRQWFSTKAGDKRLKRTLYMGRIANPTEYEVTVFTSDLPGASSDSNVYILLHGDRGSSGVHFLSSGPDDFQRGVRNEFHIEDINIGELQHVTIGHDNTGRGPSWHLDHLIVNNLRTGKKSTVPARCWFAQGHAEGLLERKLKVASYFEDKKTEYIISCITSDIRGAGTDADVFVCLHGESSSSERVMLPSAPEDFERGTKSVFVVSMPPVGELQQMTVGHNNKGFNAAWHLDYAEVVEKATGRTKWFPCGHWISSSIGDGSLERTLVATDANPEESLEDYDVEVYTSDIRGAGTDANVYCLLHGVIGSSAKLKLPGRLEAFDRGAHDTFTLRGLKGLGSIHKLTIGHDNSGPAPDWHLDRVVVTARRSGKTVVFPCHQWLSQSREDNKTIRELLPEGQQQVPDIHHWEVRVHTSDIRGAGTDARVHVELHGTQGTIGPRQLDDHHDNFERGKLDVFNLEDKDIGSLESLDVWHDNTGHGPAWHLEMIEVKNLTKECSWWFLANTWLSLEQGLRRTLHPRQTDPNATLKDYTVVVYTGDLKGAGTDAGVTIELIGDQGASGQKQLMAEYDTFERHQRDEFPLRLPDLGRLKQVIVTSDGKGHAPAWYVEKVDIIDTSAGVTTTFPAKQWLRGTDLHATLTPAQGPLATQAELWDVQVWTSDVRGAGTDADVFVQVLGSLGTSAELQLHSRSMDAWERGQVDECQPILLDVGSPQQLRVWHNGRGASPAWHLNMISLSAQAQDGASIFFPCNSWIGRDGVSELTIRGQTTDPRESSTDYEIQICTSDIRGAGTDATVSLRLYGSSRDSSWLRLDNGNNIDPFERGMTDTFKISCQNLGELKSCKIGHDSRGENPAWHLSHVKVTDLSARRSWLFHADRWLDARRGDGAASVTLSPSQTGPQKSKSKYKVKLHTGDMKGAGTDANVYLILHGSAGKSDKKILAARGQDDFERGKVDELSISLKDVGNLDSVCVGIDSSLPGASWNCKLVEVQPEGSSSWTAFPCNRWLDTKNPEYRLYAEGTPNAFKDVTYQVNVHTSDLKGAGTDSDVYIRLHGPKGSTGELQLPGSSSSFERGKMDSFTLAATDVGNVDKMYIRQSKSGSSWHLDMVEVFSQATNQRYYFDCGQWLDVANGMDRMLHATGENPRANMSKYKVTTYTSDLQEAGAYSRAFIEIQGEKGTTGKLNLTSGKYRFEKGKVDDFFLKGRAVGEISHISVGHDHGAWHIDRVEVTDLAVGKVVHFQANSLLDQYNGMTHKLQPGLHSKEHHEYENRTRLPTPLVEHVPSPRPIERQQSADLRPSFPIAEYDIVVVTGNEVGCGTASAVSVTLHGQKHSTGLYQLPSREMHFQRGCTDTFTLDMEDVGDIEAIDVVHHGNGKGSQAWLLESVEVRNVSTDDRAFFRHGSWLDPEHGMSVHLCRVEKTAQRESMDVDTIPAQGSGPFVTHSQLRTATRKFSPSMGGEVYEDRTAPASFPSGYQVTFETKRALCAGTGGLVSFDIIGSKGSSGRIQVHSSKKNFARGAYDSFWFPKLPYLGSLTQLRVYLNTKTLVGSGWALNSVTVSHVASEQTWYFYYNGWVDKKTNFQATIVPMPHTSTTASSTPETAEEDSGK